MEVSTVWLRCLVGVLIVLAAVAVLSDGVAVAATDAELADRVVVRKSERKLYLMNGEEVLRAYDIALGLVPEGHKREEGDFKTPEGDYRLTNRRIDSDFFMAIQISYPNSADVAQALERGVSPGSHIMIHGQPGRPKHPASYYRKFDWTDGCIAVSNSAMVDIWQLTAKNTPISILP